MWDVDWRDISYLKQGNAKQKHAYDVLIRTELFTVLEKYDPVLVSTVNVNLDTEESDLDVICQASNLEEFCETVRARYGAEQNFFCQADERVGQAYTICSFSVAHFIIEIYAENTPVDQQHAFRHLNIFNRLIHIGGDSFRKKIMILRKRGMKVEEAIAHLLGLRGNPYQSVLFLEELSFEDIKELLRIYL